MLNVIESEEGRAKPRAIVLLVKRPKLTGRYVLMHTYISNRSREKKKIDYGFIIIDIFQQYNIFTPYYLFI